MKKLFLALALTFGFAGLASAQTKPAVKATTTTTKSKTTAAPMKADGTPDMRYKANQTTKTTVVAGPKKADGTADMRYKANKVAVKSTTKTTTTKTP